MIERGSPEALWIEECLDFLCGCNLPGDGYRLIRDVLETQPIGKILNGDDGVQHFILSVLTHCGLIEHGTLLTRSWLTVKGMWVLGQLKADPNPDYLDDLTNTMSWSQEELAAAEKIRKPWEVKP